MPDLADRISRAAVAALDLAPFDDRFASLSRQVLAGGAARFGNVVDERQAISYVIPVGVAGERIDYGALVLQPNSAGLLWRGVGGVDQHAIVSITSSTPATYSTVSLRGESWLRFSVGSASRLTFLIPPVNSRVLLPTLVEYFAARPGPAPATVLPEPDLAPLPGGTDEKTVALPVPPAQPLPAEEYAGPIPTLPVPVRLQDPEATQVVPRVNNELDAETAGTQNANESVKESHWAPVGAFDLYRDEPRTTPTAEPTRVLQVPGPIPGPERSPRHDRNTLAEPHQPVTAENVFECPQTSSGNLRFFFIGLLATLGAGTLVILVQIVT